MKNFKILDCTLRDGGYYTNWSYDNDLVNDYLSCMNDLDIDFVEIGLKGSSKEKGYGSFAYTEEKLINKLNKPSKLKISIMINATDLKNQNFLEQIPNKKKSKVVLYRIATHYKDIDKSIQTGIFLKKKGYLVGINLMQISSYDLNKLTSVIKKLNKTNFDFIYIADSFGSMDGVETRKYLEIIKKNTNKSLGVHMHDNQGLAIHNTISALESGIKIADSTITGMGRGPGNVKTEELVFIKNKFSEQKYFKISSLINKHFLKLKKNYQWGSNMHYLYSGAKKIHPTYVQNMLSDNSYDHDKIYSTLKSLNKNDIKKFNPNLLSEYKNNDLVINSNKLNKFLKTKNFLILGPGKSVNQFKNQIENFIKKNNVCVVALNSTNSVNSNLIKARSVSNSFKFWSELKKIKKMDQMIILPSFFINSQTKTILKRKKLLFYDFQVVSNLFSVNKNLCKIPKDLVLCYALCLAIKSKADNIFCAGLDGYEKNEENKNVDVNLVISQFKTTFKRKLVSLTPTKYDLQSVDI